MTSSIDIKDLQLNALLEVTQAINNNLSEDDLFKIYKFTLLAGLKIKKLALYTEQGEKWICRVCFGAEGSCDDIQLKADFLAIKQEQKLVKDASFFGQFDLAFPVFHKEKLLAIVFVSAGEDSVVENRFLNALTNIILVAIENKTLAKRQMEQEAYQRELEIAKKVQNFLFPKELPKTEKLNIEALYLPHHDVGGDYYDYIRISDHKFMICIADVSGKGVPAALLMSNFQASLRTLIRRTNDLKEIVTELNHTTFVSGNAENLITFFVAIYNFKTKELEYINCGHNEMILKQDQMISLLNEGTTVLGMFNPLPFMKTEVIDDLTDFFLFAYTDGLTETFNEEDEPLGLDRMIQLVENKVPAQLADFHQDILARLGEFRGELSYHDDITMLSCRVQNL